MAYQSLGLGSSAGDGTGDSIRDGGDKINDNFSEIYTLLGTGTALTSGISATATVVSLSGPTITGVASFADGSNSAPSITNTGDTNTGIYFGAADTVSVTTGGTKRLDVDSSGIDVVGAITATTTITGTTITGTTLEATGDTSSVDNAAMGYTAAEGLILTGQGSTSDITLKNDADTVVFTVPTGTDDIHFPDSGKAIWGTGSDLTIHHDSSNSYIKDEGTGTLYICGSTVQLNNSGNSEPMLIASENGGVVLYYDNSAKIQTTSAGATVTGVLTATLQANAIDSDHYVDDSIDEAHIANDAVGSNELKTLSTLLIKNSGGSTLATFHTAGA